MTSESASWTPLDKLDRMERGVKEATSDLTAAAGGLPPGIKLQMRIAMEHCDLGMPLLCMPLGTLCVVCSKPNSLATACALEANTEHICAKETLTLPYLLIKVFVA